MTVILSLEDFLRKNHISQKSWEESGCDLMVMSQIAESHDRAIEHLRDTAEFFARVIQKIPSVHSVRWRVKETSHLVEKIVRKCIAGSEKYLKIDASNYSETVTDLVGLRALHLFKGETLDIDAAIREIWTPMEKPVAYVRDGDQQGLAAEFSSRGIEIKEHPAGYRSVHYVFSSQPTQRKVLVEVQTRTLFEEGWSEIDHRVKYPNFSDNPAISYFLTIFNRLAGSADEMGSFVQTLTTTLHEQERRISEANRQHEMSLEKMEATIFELEELRQQDAESRASVADLKGQISKLKKDLHAGKEVPGLLGLDLSMFEAMHGLSANLGLTQLDAASSAQRLAATLPHVGLLSWADINNLAKGDT